MFFSKRANTWRYKGPPFRTYRCPGSALRVGRPSQSSRGAGGQEVGQAGFGVSRVPDRTLRHLNELPPGLRGTQGRCSAGGGVSEPPVPGCGPLQEGSAREASSPRVHDSRPAGAGSLRQAVFLDPGPARPLSRPCSFSGILERRAERTKGSPSAFSPPGSSLATPLRFHPATGAPSANVARPSSILPAWSRGPRRPERARKPRERGTHRARWVGGAEAPSCGPPWPGRPVSRELGVNSPEWSAQACSPRRRRYPGPAGPELPAAQVRQPPARGLPDPLRLAAAARSLRCAGCVRGPEARAAGAGPGRGRWARGLRRLFGHSVPVPRPCGGLHAPAACSVAWFFLREMSIHRAKQYALLWPGASRQTHF